jgi:flagella synthesis protein FlgN
MDHQHATLAAVLSDQVRCAEHMLRTLGRENRALIDGNAEELNAAGAEKARLVETLETLENERRTLTEAIARTLGDTARERAGTQRLPEWQQLLELIAKCKQHNEHNGALVKARSEQVRIAIRALRGAEPDLYGRSGHEPTSADARPLGSA